VLMNLKAVLAVLNSAIDVASHGKIAVAVIGSRIGLRSLLCEW
jgi:hypothetical protein